MNNYSFDLYNLYSYASTDTLIELVFDAVEDVIDLLDEMSDYSLTEILNEIEPELCKYIQTLNKKQRQKIEDEFCTAVHLGKFRPLRKKCDYKDTYIYHIDEC